MFKKKYEALKMDMVFITRAKIESLIRFFNVCNECNYKDLIYHDRLAKILAKPELKNIMNFKAILEEIDDIPLYDKSIVNKFTEKNKINRMVYIGGKSSYHKDISCKYLKSDYENFEIPIEIPDDKIDEYRGYFIKNRSMYDSKIDVFFANVELKFNVRINNIKKINENNSGIERTENIKILDLDEIVSLIENHLTIMESYRKSSDEHEEKIKRFGYGSHKASFTDNNGNRKLYVDDNKSIIFEWNELKHKLKNLIKQYFISKLNPDFKFNKNILDQCGFVPCKGCVN